MQIEAANEKIVANTETSQGANMLNKETKAMIINELNTGLIEAAKEKVPAGANLANTLMDILYIGKEAIYRRLRGEVPFTLAEAAVISRKLGISLDKMIGVSFSNNAVFDLNVVHHSNTFETYHDILTRYVNAFDSIREDPTTEMATSSNILPTLALQPLFFVL